MGYRSEIGVMITMPKHAKYEDIIKRFRKGWNDDEDFDYCFEIKRKEYYGDRFIFIHSKIDLKWYEGSFKDVDGFMDVIRKWTDTYKTGGVHYVRIGERVDDLEEEIYGDN